MQSMALDTKQKRFEELRSMIKTDLGNFEKGKPVFDQQCGTCHRLHDDGGNLGPDLTGYERRNLDVMLQHVVDPNAEIREGYVNYTITTKAGNTLSGFFAGRRGKAVVLRSFSGEEIVLAESEVASMQAQPISLMPEGLLQPLSEQQIQNLFAYLMR